MQSRSSAGVMSAFKHAASGVHESDTPDGGEIYGLTWAGMCMNLHVLLLLETRGRRPHEARRELFDHLLGTIEHTHALIDAYNIVGQPREPVISMDFSFVGSGNLKRKATGEPEYVVCSLKVMWPLVHQPMVKCKTDQMCLQAGRAKKRNACCAYFHSNTGSAGQVNCAASFSPAGIPISHTV